MSGPVLILYCEPRPSAFTESDAGVLDEVKAVEAALSCMGYRYRTASVRTLEDVAIALSGSDEQILFNLVEVLWTRPEDYNYVPLLARSFGKAFTGNDAIGMLLAHDKWWAKAILRANGLPCPNGVILQPGQRIEMIPFDGPWIVKPSRSDASEGIDSQNVAWHPQALANAIELVHTSTNQPAIVEQYIDGREINVSILWYDGRPEVLPLAEIEFRDFPPQIPRIVGYRAKWIPDSLEYRNTVRVIPADLPSDLAWQIRQLVVQACRALGCTDYCRVDIRIDNAGRPFILEVNPNPDISPESGFAAALQAAGISYDRFIRILIENAQARSTRDPNIPTQRTIAASGYKIRPSGPDDRQQILDILAASRVFRPDEMAVAMEVIDAAHGQDQGYQSYVAVDSQVVLGWICFGKAPCTVGSFDIYWLVTAQPVRRMGIARALVGLAEQQIQQQGGRLVVIETSSRQVYAPARSFYQQCGYRVVATVPDFYGRGDDKLIYTKVLVNYPASQAPACRAASDQDL